MANQVKFWRGTSLTGAPAENGYLAYIYDTGLYVHDGTKYQLIADKTVLDQDKVNELVAEALKNFYTKAEIDAFLANYRTSAAQDEIDNGIKASIKSITDDYLVGADKTELEGKITAHETAVNTKFNDYRTSAAQDVIDQAQDKALTDYKAEMVETLKGYQTTIPAETYDAFGAAATAEQNAKDYSDGKLAAVVEQYLTGEGAADTIDTLNEIADWINSDEAGATKIISDVATNAADIKNIKESAPMTSGITAAKVGEYDATKSTVDANKAIWDKAGTAVQPEAISDMMTKTEHTTFVNGNAALNSGITADKVSGYDTTKSTVDSKSGNWDTAYGWGNHASAGYAKAADLGDLAGKNETELNLKALAYKATVGTADIDNDAVTADKLADSINTDIAAGVAAKAETDKLKSAAFTEATAYATAEQGTKADNAATDIAAMKNLPFYNINATDINNWDTAHTEVEKLGDVAYKNTTSTGLEGGVPGEDNSYENMKDFVPTSADVLSYLKAHYRGNAAESVNLGTLVTAINTITGKPAYNIEDSDITAWNAEKGAKALAETKTTAAEVKTQIEAYGYATEVSVSNQDAVVLAESQKYTDTAKAEAIADAEGKVNALAEGQVATNKQDIADLLAQLTWGEV